MRRTDTRASGRAVLVFLAVAVLVSSVALWRHEADAEPDVVAGPPPTNSAPAVPHRFSVLFAGDSFTGGTGGPSSSWNAYPCILARTRGWTCNVDAEGSTGFVNDGSLYGDHRSRKLIDRLDRDKQLYAVDMVFVDAGRNDLGLAPDTVVPAVSEYLAKAAALWPSAKIVLLLPFFLATAPYDNYGLLEPGIAAAVGAVHGTLLDPLSERWFADVPLSQMLLPDGVHPSALGNEFIANKIAESLARRGLGNLGGAS